MKRTILRLVIIAATVTCASGFGLVPADASVSVSVAKVEQCDASGSNCSPISVDGSQVAQGIIRVTANVQGGLLDLPKWLRVIASDDGGNSYTCIGQASVSSAQTTNENVTKQFTWDTSAFPAQSGSGCTSSGSYGAVTHNGVLRIKAQAYNAYNSQTSTSASATVLLNNAPSAPVWASNPSVSGAAERQPVVTLSWKAAPEPDVVEYHFLRQDPGSSSAKEYAVSASSPGDQGCQFSSGVYTCFDSDYPTSGFGGSHSYWLVAYRLSPSSADHCSNGTNCIQSPISEQRTVSMTEPTPSPSSGPSSGATATPGGTNLGARPGSVASTGGSSAAPAGENPAPEVLSNRVNQDTFCFTCGSYKKTLPYGGGSFGSLPGDGGTPGGIPSPNGQNPVLAAGSPLGAGGTGTDPRQLWSSVAAGLVLLLTAAHVARILRATAH